MEGKPTLSRQGCLDQLTDAMEGAAIAYWGREFGPIKIKRDNDLNIIEAHVKVEGDDGRFHTYTIYPGTIQLGVDILFSEGFQIGDWIKRQIVNEDFDIVTGDVIIQAALFGEIIYG